jgi:hypothetical protein
MCKRFIQRNKQVLGRVFATFLGLVLFVPSPVGAVLIIGPTDSNGDPTGGQNLSAPTGALAGSGWDLEGTWQTDFTGIPIAPNYFITAGHVGGQVGDTFVLNGVDFTTTAAFGPPDNSDLVIWKVNGTFSSYAPVYSGSNELNQQLVTFGRSGGDGPMSSNGTPLNGWQWSPTLTGALSWGSNTVSFAGNIDVNGVTNQYLTFNFDKTLGPNTGALAAGDSGGGVFIQVNGVWTLAGINESATGPYNTVPGNSPSTTFNASLYDSTGLFFDGTTQPATGPSISLATRLSTESDWISSVTGIAVPEPGASVLLAFGLVLAWPLARYQASKVDRIEQDV